MKKYFTYSELQKNAPSRMAGFGDGFFSMGRLVERSQRLPSYSLNGLERDFFAVGSSFSSALAKHRLESPKR